VVLGIITLGGVVIGYFGDRTTLPERCGLALCTLLLWYHEALTSIAGGVLMIGIYLIQRRRKRGREGK
jgi:TRAP-type uncharacterized transport system fused permease subunit